MRTGPSLNPNPNPNPNPSPNPNPNPNPIPNPNLREMLGAIKIAVLAPCIKVSIASGEALQAGAASQVDFTHMRALLEEKVLSRWSSVKLLGDAVG